jgi:hypothetical protein
MRQSMVLTLLKVFDKSDQKDEDCTPLVAKVGILLWIRNASN